MKNWIARAVVTFVFAGLACPNAPAQTPQQMADPAELGLLIPRNKMAIEISDRNVLLPPELTEPETSKEKDPKDAKTKATQPVVARVYVEIGNRYIVSMPDGSLRSVLKRETTRTDRPFVPVTKKQLAKQLEKQFKGFKTRSTRRYLCVYNTSDGFCEGTTAILESMYPMLLSYFNRKKLSVDAPDIPLVVVMFRTKAEFQRYRQMPETMLAYYNGVNNRVFLYQYSGRTTDAPTIAIKQSISTVAHEGVHQILHNIGVQKRLAPWPIWISEGMAEYFAPTSTKGAKWKGVGKPNDLRMRELFKHFNSVRGLGNGNQIQHVISADRLNSTEYAIVWALTHYLITKREKDFFKYLRTISERSAFEEPIDESEQFEEFFGSDFAKIERELIKHVRSLPYTDPIANQPYFLISAVSGKRRFAIITSSLNHTNAKKKLLEKMSQAERANARFLPSGRFRNLALAKQAMAIFTRRK